MRFILISILTVFFTVGALIILISRTSVPPMVEGEKRQLVEILPILRSAARLTITSGAPEAGLQKIKNLSGLDLTIVNANSVIRYTTLAGGKLAGSQFSVGEKGATVFEMVSIDQTPSFVVSTPLWVGSSSDRSAEEQELTLAISKPDKLIGKFFDELFTNVILVGLLGIAASIPVGLYQRRRSKPANISLAPVSEALSALARKDFSYRMRENIGGDPFRRAQAAFNSYMEEMSQAGSLRSRRPDQDLSEEKLDQPPVSLSIDSAESAFRAALGSIEEGIVIVEQSGKIAAFNRKMEELTGLRADVVAGKLFTNVLAIYRQGGEEVTGMIPGILSTGVSEVFPDDLMARRRDGTFVPVAIKAVAIRKDLRGAVTHLVVVVNAKVVPGAGSIVIEKKPRSKQLEEAQAETRRKDVSPALPVAPVIEKQAAPVEAHKGSEQLPIAALAKLPAVVSARTAAIIETAPKTSARRSDQDTKDYGAPPPNLPI